MADDKTKRLRGFARGFHTINSRLSDDALLILKASRNLPKELREQAGELVLRRQHGKFKAEFAGHTRDVVNSIVVGQLPWYVIFPIVSAHFPEIRESPARWFIWGLDKLFIGPQNFYETPGIAWENAEILARMLPPNKIVGGALLAGEFATDLSRSLIEYYAQRRMGIYADAASRSYGDAGRPFWARYSTLEFYQKLLIYLANPQAIGTPEQMRNSIGGIMGSLFRTGPQLGAIALAYNALKRANLYRFTPGALVEAGINKAKPNLAKGGRGEKEEAEAQLKEIFGGDWEILQAQLHAQEKSPNPFHIINPALTWEQARNLVKARAEILKAGVAMRAVRARKAEVGKIEEFNLSFDNAVQELRAVAGKKADEIPELQELRGAKKAGSVSEMKKNLGMLARAHARMKLG